MAKRRARVWRGWGIFYRDGIHTFASGLPALFATKAGAALCTVMGKVARVRIIREAPRRKKHG